VEKGTIMTISELIDILTNLKRQYGDLPIVIRAISQNVPPHPVLRTDPERHIVLNRW
jgi:hypothetical protein